MSAILFWMEINIKWTFLKTQDLPGKPGVYLFRSPEELLYIGKAANLKKRIKDHFQKKAFRDTLFMDKVSRVGYIITDSEIEALLLESKLIKKYRPKYNVIWKDDKNYFYVAITKDTLPKIFITHQPQVKIENLKLKINYIGPFVDGKALKKTLRFLRQIFPYYTATRHSMLPCPYCYLDLCPGPNPNSKEYKKNIKIIASVLRSGKTSVLKIIEHDMKSAAKAQDFELAAKKRDQFFALQKTLSNARILGWGDVEHEKNEWQKMQKIMQKILGLPVVWRRLEACDIANIQGQDATGSIVTFIDGKPDKNFYRKFKIKISGKPNDTAMIKETISRRLRHKEWGMPDILLIDGGKAQLNAALKSKVQNPKSKKIKIIALAKKNNELFIGGRKKPLLLKNLPPAVSNFILRIRDEAHRFSRVYHHLLRAKTLAN